MVFLIVVVIGLLMCLKAELSVRQKAQDEAKEAAIWQTIGAAAGVPVETLALLSPQAKKKTVRWWWFAFVLVMVAMVLYILAPWLKAIALVGPKAFFEIMFQN